jgi:hypothetical protein
VEKVFICGPIDKDVTYTNGQGTHTYTLQTHHYTITGHVEGVVLEHVWDDLDGKNREEIINSLVPVISAFYQMKKSDKTLIR